MIETGGKDRPAPFFEMSDLSEVMAAIERSGRSRWVTAWRRADPVQGELQTFPENLDPRLAAGLEARGIRHLYSHQFESYQHIMNNIDTVIVTPTASGKTLCYNLPVFARHLADRRKRFLYIFPTKALAHDQLHELEAWNRLLDHSISSATYDADTPASQRVEIRRDSAIVLTNPDMLHSGMLPHHPKWRDLFANLDLIVIDEMHLYRGVFGSHMTNVIRRMKRICRFYGSSPQFIFTSATVANPRELASRLIEGDVGVIDRSGAPSGEKTFIFYNPPLIDHEQGIRRSYLAEAAWFAKELLKQGIQTVVFVRSRMNVEILVNELRASVTDDGLKAAIRGYRGGYMPGERREIENGLRSRTILCVVATSALELGVDIGDLEASILAGYPGTISSTWQRAGRAGRKTKASLAVLVASPFPLDQYMIRHPDYFFASPPEFGLINPDNLMIVLDHVRAAAFELPFSAGEVFSPALPIVDFLTFLEEQGELRQTRGSWHFTGQSYPAERISLRSISADNIMICEITSSGHRVIGQIDGVSASFLIYPQAIYLHEGRQYLVENLDQENKRAFVRASGTDYYTFPIERSEVHILRISEQDGSCIGYGHGDVRVMMEVTGFKRIRFHTMENLGYGILQMPPSEWETTAFWIDFPLARFLRENPMDPSDAAIGIMGVLAGMHSIAAALVMCDPQDLGTAVTGMAARFGPAGSAISLVPPPDPAGSGSTDETAVGLFIYDRYPGGVGFSEHLFRVFPKLIRSMLDLIDQCECRSGCPGCIGPVDRPSASVKQVARAMTAWILKYCDA